MFLGSSCIYPRDCPLGATGPFGQTPQSLWSTGEGLAELARKLRQLLHDWISGDWTAERSAPAARRLSSGAVEPVLPASDPDIQTLQAALEHALKSASLRDAATDVAKMFGVSRKTIYNLGLKIGGDS